MLENMTTGEKALIGATAIGIAALVFHKPTRNAVGLSDGKRKKKATEVKFYKDGKDIIAVFPYEMVGNKNQLQAFDGNHLEVDSDYVKSLKSATESEYKDLENMMRKQYAYNLKPIKKITWRKVPFVWGRG